MLVRAAVVLAVAAGAAIAVVSCGGGDDPKAGTTSTAQAPAPSKAEFIKQANAACREARAGLGERIARFEGLRDGRKPEPGADMVHFVYLPTMETQIWRIEELGVPREEDEEVDAMLDAERDGVDAVAVIPRVSSIARADRHFVEADRLFREYGLDACITDGRQPDA